MDLFIQYFPILLFTTICIALLFGYPVAFSLSGVSLLFTFLAIPLGLLSERTLTLFPSRIYGIMTNEVLVAIPLFVFMGVMLERSKIAEELVNSINNLFGNIRGGVAYAVILVGMLMAASTGIVGASVITMGLLSLPCMLRYHYSPAFSSGLVAASGTLGQIIPPSIILVLLGDVMGNAYQEAQRSTHILSGETVSVGDLFSGALIPGLLLVLCYLLYTFASMVFSSKIIPKRKYTTKTRPSFINTLQSLFPPLILILAVLGSILAGLATPTEASALGALGASFIAVLKQSTLKKDPLAVKIPNTVDKIYQ